MDDTSLAMKQKMKELIRSKSPGQRLMMGCSMFDCSKRLVTGAILRESPNLTERDLRAEVFLKFYGHDFGSSDKAKILAYLREVTGL